MSGRTFFCSVRTSSGDVAVVERAAESERDLLDALHAEGLFPFRISEEQPVTESGRGGRETAAAETFFRIAYFFAKARLPMTAAAEAYDKAYPGSSGGGLAASLSAGHPLSSSIEEHFPHVPRFVAGLVAAGERSGDLAPALQHASAYYDQQRRLRDTCLAAAAYPAVLGVMGLISVFAVLLFVVPRIKGVLGTASLPPLTAFLIGYAAALRTPGGFFLSAFVLAAVCGALYVFRERLLVFIPWYRRYAADRDAFAVCAGLRMLISSRVPVADAFSVLAESASGPAEKKLRAVAAQLRAGSSLPDVLRTHTVFGPTSDVIIAGGYESGSFVDALAAAEEESRSRMERSMQIMNSLIEPAVLLIVGGVLGTVIIGIMLPLMDVSQRGM